MLQKVFLILVNRWILPICEVALPRVCNQQGYPVYFFFKIYQFIWNYSCIHSCLAPCWLFELTTALILSLSKSVQQSPLNWIPAHLRYHLGPPTVTDPRFHNILLEKWLSTDNKHCTFMYLLGVNRVSKSNGKTVVRMRKYFLSLRKILRIECPN